MTDIFISYKREEREKAELIAKMLVKHGYDVWWDINLLPGDKFSREIDEVIKNASAAIVLWSKKAVASDFVRAEASRANSNNILISVRLDECEIPIPYNIQHFLDLSAWDNDVDSPLLLPLLGAVEKKIGSRSVINDEQTSKEIEHKVEKPKALGEIEYWKSISAGGTQNVQGYEAYINKYGSDGIFNDLSKMRIDELNNPVFGTDSTSALKKAISIALALIVIAVIAFIYFRNEPKPKEEPQVGLCENIDNKAKLRNQLFESIKTKDINSAKGCMNKLNTVNFHNQFGHSPLSSAAFHGNLQIVKLLISRGAKVNMGSDERGQHRTPLHFAIKNGHKEVAIFLICKNAATNARDSLGKTPLDYDASESYRNVKCE